MRRHFTPFVSVRALGAAVLVLRSFVLSVRAASADLLPAPPRGATWTAKAEHYAAGGMTALPAEIRSMQHLVSRSYVITGETLIDSGATLDVPAGATLLFEPGAALRVRGILQVKGMADAPVRLRCLPPGRAWFSTGAHDSAWTGILVEPAGALRLEHVAISGAQRGIVAAAPCDSLRILSVLFAPQLPLVVGGNTVNITPDLPFTLNCRPAAPPAAAHRGGFSGRNSLRIGACVAATCTASAGIYFHARAAQLQRRTDAATDTREARRLQEQGDQAFALRNLMAGLAALSAGMFVVTFTF